MEGRNLLSAVSALSAVRTVRAGSPDFAGGTVQIEPSIRELKNWCGDSGLNGEREEKQRCG